VLVSLLLLSGRAAMAAMMTAMWLIQRADGDAGVLVGVLAGLWSVRIAPTRPRAAPSAAAVSGDSRATLTTSSSGRTGGRTCSPASVRRGGG